jgi:outer membrane protein
MKNSLFLLIIIFAHTAPAQASISLKESFEAAKLNMESIKRADTNIEISEEQQKRAYAALRPTISGVGSYTKIDPPDAAGRSPFLLTRQYSGAIRMVQPLLRGGVLSAQQLAKENILLAKYRKDATELNLYQLVINSYYSLNIAQVDLHNLNEYLKYSRDRVKELQQRTNIGKSRKGELVEAEAQLLTAESQYQQSLTNLQQAERNFEFYTKRKLETIIVPDEVPKVSGSLGEYLMKLRDRPDLLATRQQTRVAQEQITIAAGGHYPTMDLITNYYLTRTGVLETSDWDLGVVLTIPLYQGGGVQAAVREAVDNKRVAELTNFEAERTAERDLAINFRNFELVREQLKSLKQALAKAEEAYRLNKKDYEFGLVTNLDVLQTLNFFIETKRSYNGLIAFAHMNYKTLEASIGVLP